MKPFDLEAAKRGEPIQTRDGRPAKFIAHVPELSNLNQVYAHVQGTAFLNSYSKEGTLTTTGTSEIDLFMAPKKRTVWVNLYEYTKATKRFDAYAYASEELADNGRCADRIGGKAWPLEIEE